MGDVHYLAAAVQGPVAGIALLWSPAGYRERKGALGRAWPALSVRL